MAGNQLKKISGFDDKNIEEEYKKFVRRDKLKELKKKINNSNYKLKIELPEFLKEKDSTK